MPRRGAALVAEFARCIFKRRLGIAKSVPAVRASKLAINENSHAGFPRARTSVVGREDTRRSSRDNESLSFSEKPKRDTNTLMLRRKESSFTVERIDEDAPQSRSRKREEMAAAHVREFSKGTEA